MWKDLSPQWQSAFEEAWTAYQSGSVPIGAAVYAPDGTLLVRERNRSGEPDAPYPAIVHAEANAIISASSEEMLGATIYMTCTDPRSGELGSGICSCSMCKRMAINAGIKEVVVRETPEEYTVYKVSDWVENDDSIFML